MSDFKDNINKKVFFLIPSLVGGGAERILINILQLIENSGFEIDLYLSVKKGPLLLDVPDRVKVYSLFPSSIVSRVASYLYRKFGLVILYRLWGQKITSDYDVGVSFLDGSSSQFLFYSKGVIEKKVVVIHSSYISFQDVSQSTRSAHFHRMKRRYEMVDTIITVSEESRLEFQRLFGNFPDIRTIYNPLHQKDILQKGAVSISEIPLNNSFTMIAIGSLTPVKGFDRLIEASRLLNENGLFFQVWIIGEGILRKQLEQQIADYGLEEKVKLWGFQKNPYPFLKSADLLVVSSHSEGLPTVVCEAMILEKPILATNITGCRELLDNGIYGMMVDNTTEGLYKGMKKLVQDPEQLKHFQKKASERKQLFNDERAIRAYLQLICGK